MVPIILFTALNLWFVIVQGDSTNLALINLTPYSWKQSQKSHSYGMTHWDDNLPQELHAVKYYDSFVQIEVGLFVTENDDAAEAYYTLDDGSDNEFELQLRVDGPINFHINLDGLSIQNNPSGSSVDVGFLDDSDQWTPIVLAGDKGSYVGNNPPSDWMHRNLAYLGCRTLQELTVPGSHDAGMSELHYGTFGSTPANTQTQTLNILEQLNAGVRFFDIRPVISHAHYSAGHYDGNLGAAGQSIDDIIDNVNSFTASNEELVILYLSHSADTDSDYEPFDEAQYSSLLSKFTSDLNYLWESDTESSLTTIPLSEFISDGAAVVIIMDERTQEFLSDGGFIGKGVFHKSQFPNYNSYANSDDLDKMQQDQYEKFTAQKSEPTYGSEQVFVLSWTMTLSIADAINLALDHITTRADIANGHLAQLKDLSITGAEPYRISPFLWSTQPPNIILIDNVKKNKHLTTLALAFNRYYSGC